MFDLTRFETAQASAGAGFETARRELAAGRKSSHWIWYIFPQLDGLGQSTAARHYGLRGPEEAMAYLRDPLLRARLLDVATVVATQLQHQPAPALVDLMGARIDALKLISSMTLFRVVAQRLQAHEPDAEYAELAARADEILAAAARQGFTPCAFTTAQLA